MSEIKADWRFSVLEKKLQKSCYNYLEKNYPDVLELAGWSNYAYCELNLVTALYFRFKLSDTILARWSKRRTIAKLLTLVQNIRHAAVHYTRSLPIRMLAIMVRDGLGLVEEFGDNETATILRSLYQKLNSMVQNAADIHQKKEAMEIRLSEKSAKIKANKELLIVDRMHQQKELLLERHTAESQIDLLTYDLLEEDQHSLHELLLVQMNQMFAYPTISRPAAMSNQPPPFIFLLC